MSMQFMTTSMSKERHDEIESIIIQSVRAELLRVFHEPWMDQKRAIFDLRFGKPENFRSRTFGKKWDIAKWGLYGFKLPLTQ